MDSHEGEPQILFDCQPGEDRGRLKAPPHIKYRLRELGPVGQLLRDPHRSAELLMAFRLNRLLSAR